MRRSFLLSPLDQDHALAQRIERLRDVLGVYRIAARLLLLDDIGQTSSVEAIVAFTLP